jgi:N-acetylglucosamine malate deacetylase 1
MLILEHYSIIMKLDILAFGAHPDDVELGAGGVIAKEVANGKKVAIIDLTRGELGTRGSADLRDLEAIASSKVLGIEFRLNLGFRDGFFLNDEAHKLVIIKQIRKYKPTIVLCNAIFDRHIDHGRGSNLVSEACFLSGLSKIITSYDGINQEAWRPEVVYHYIQDRFIKPDFVVDISDFMETKMSAVKAFSSQFYNPNSTEPETAISGITFLEFVASRAKEVGRPVGFSYAEAFTVERTMGVNSVFDLL